MNYPSNRYTGPSPWMDYEWLYDQYITQDKRTEDIASEYGCRQNTIQCWLLRHGIKKKIKRRYHKPKHQYEDREYLYHNHIELHKSISDIARENNVSWDTIRGHLDKNHIEPQLVRGRSKYSSDDIDIMVVLYCDEMLSANAIAKMFNTDHNTIIRCLRSRGIDTRGLSASQYATRGLQMNKDLSNRDLMFKLHWEDGMSCKDIGALYGVDPGTVRRQMSRIGVKTRNNAESKIGLMTGDKHHNWKGGVTPLYSLLREYFHTNQVPVISKRDNYTCQLCGATHVVLHVHHIRGFSEIVKEICGEHKDLNTNDPEDRMRLYDIITHDARFLDENNLITFCKDCHLSKIHNYNRKTISSQASKEEGSETIL